MRITIKEMIVRNFKGISNFELVAKGNNLDVRGDNGTGKTSLYDAFLWCLFGKNSQDQSDTKFDWKPLDQDGNERHRLETFVNVEFDIDGVAKVFSRTITEKWTKKRGSIVDTFDGHTTAYHIDGLKVTQKDYKAEIEALGGESLFQMLTKVNYFAEVMKSDDRRKILLEMAGDVSESDVIASNKELAKLPDILDGKSVEERTALVKQAMKQVNKDIKELPGRIDEAQRSLPDLEELDKQELATRKLALQADLARAQEELSIAKSPAAMSDLVAKRAELKTKFANEERAYIQTETDKYADEVGELQKHYDKCMDEIQELGVDIFNLKEKLKHINAKKDSRKHTIKILEGRNDELRDMFNQDKLEVFPDFDEHKLSCPVCGRQYDESKLAEIKANYDKELSDYNKAKAERMAEYKARGKGNKAKIIECQDEIAELEKEEAAFTHALESHNALLDYKTGEKREILAEMECQKNRFVYFHNTERGLELRNQYDKLERQIEALERGEQANVIELQAKIDSILAEINDVNDLLYRFELHAKQQERVDELIAKEQSLGLKFGELEQQLMVLEEYVRTKVSLLTETINSQFRIVKFKLFDTAINGGLIECCEPTVGGANYSTGLNNAARINAGLDIINALMSHYDLHLPLFVDNAESVNELIEVDTQVITLSVSQDKKLTVKE
ncbi:AAA family ATPase [Abiotrophia defectiva]|uniref:AAA family ATPase n=1 Tax=Abiotrophia defectiva TaxID=46125 RepID=UPI0028E2CF10|nr:AAA family ATPase [Abiotrophia defectiva]